MVFRISLPRIYLASRAFGWYENHGDLLLRLYGQALGRWGAIPAILIGWVQNGYQSAPRNGKGAKSRLSQLSECFAAGINAYAQEHADLIDDEVKAVLPVDAVDVLAHGGVCLISLLLSIRRALPTLKTMKTDRL